MKDCLFKAVFNTSHRGNIMQNSEMKLSEMEPKTSKNKKFKLSMPHSYVIMGIILIAVSLLTYIIPAGEFKRVEDPETQRQIVVPGSYQHVEQSPVSIFDITTSIYEGMIRGSEIIFYVFISYGFIFMLTKTGAFDSGVGALVRKTKGKEILIIPVFMIMFGLMGATFGMYEESYGYIPLMMGIMIALGYDAIVGLAVVYIGVATGFAAALTNPFTIGIAQSIAEVPMYSGIGYRTIIFVCFMTLSISYVMRYARKIKANPEKSIVKDVNFAFLSETSSNDLVNLKFTTRHKISLILFALTIFTLVFGTAKYQWYLKELSGVLIISMIIIGLVNKLNFSRISDVFIEACKNATFGVLIIGMANAVLVVLEKGLIIDSIVYYTASTIDGVSPHIAGSAMLVIQTVLNFFLYSASAQAVTSMPIMVPLADVLELNRQIAVLAFQLGDGFANMIWPNSVAVICGIACIPMDRWYKFLWPLFISIFALEIMFVIIAVAINFGP